MFFDCVECYRETTIVPRRMGGTILSEHIRGGVGFRGGIWVRRVGKHAQLRPTS